MLYKQLKCRRYKAETTVARGCGILTPRDTRKWRQWWCPLGGVYPYIKTTEHQLLCGQRFTVRRYCGEYLNVTKTLVIWPPAIPWHLSITHSQLQGKQNPKLSLFTKEKSLNLGRHLHQVRVIQSPTKKYYKNTENKKRTNIGVINGNFLLIEGPHRSHFYLHLLCLWVLTCLWNAA